MYPYLRLFRILSTGKSGKRTDLREERVLSLRVGLFDIDPFIELNNGRHLTLMDLGRFDLAKRTGLLKLVKDKGWGLAVAGASVRYRHRLKLFQSFTLHTQAVGFDEKWFYFHQKTVRKGKIHSAALVRTAVTSSGGIVKTPEVLAAMGYEDMDFEVPDWIRAWSDADELRPWDE